MVQTGCKHCSGNVQWLNRNGTSFCRGDALVPTSDEDLLAIQRKAAVGCHGYEVLISASEVPRTLQQPSRAVVKHLQTDR